MSIDERAFNIMTVRAGIKPELIETALKFVTEYEAAKAPEQPDEEILIQLLTPLYDTVGGDMTMGGIKRDWAARSIEALRPYLGSTKRESVALEKINKALAEILNWADISSTVHDEIHNIRMDIVSIINCSRTHDK